MSARQGPSEFEIIYGHFAALGRGPAVDLGVGDDCAILRLEPGERLATSVDTFLEEVHFPAGAFPEDIAYRGVAVSVSDLAAMGARPLGMTVSLTLPEADDLWLRAFSEGLAASVSDFGLPLVGGDTSRGPLVISVVVYGAVPSDRALLRSGARPGDRLCVSGTLGDGAAALSLFDGSWKPRPEYAEYIDRRFYRPSARLALGRELLDVASAAIDISDGLVADAGHIAAASGVGIFIEPMQLPLSEALASHLDRELVVRWALTGGDDYELCFCMPPTATLPDGCTVIGGVIEGEGVDCGMTLDRPAGYLHF
jgi:thiamine-monophosphate kinase